MLEHRDMLSREDLSREEAEEFLRSKLSEKGLATKPISVGRALRPDEPGRFTAEPPPKRASRWAT